MTPDQVRAFFTDHRTVRKYQEFIIPDDHLEVMLYAAQHAPTDATAQMYSLIRITDPVLRGKIAEISHNPHIATASEAFIICADLHRLKQLLEHKGFVYGNIPAVGLHFALGDAVMAGQNLLIAAEMLGYAGCWIGGILSDLPTLAELLELPSGVVPFAGLTIGLSAETPAQRPRLARSSVVHHNTYAELDSAALEESLQRMNPISRSGDWSQTLSRYFAVGGSMETREGQMVEYLAQHGFGHVDDGVRHLDTLFAQAEAAGMSEVLLRRKPGSSVIEAWVDAGHLAFRGEDESATLALEQAIGNIAAL
jgi:FMN reductase (NADPH)